MMEKEVKQVSNKFRNDSDLGLEYQYNDEVYHVEMGRFLLLVKDSKGEIYLQKGVDSYYDCLTFNGENLFFGDRNGQIHCISLKNKEEINVFFLCEETMEYYNDHIKRYPLIPFLIREHKLGDYDYLPEMLTMNEVVSKLSISVLKSKGHFIVCGDLSGHVAIIDTELMKTVKMFTVEGAVSNIEFEGEKIIIDYITASYFDSPFSLAAYDTANRTYVCCNLDN